VDFQSLLIRAVLLARLYDVAMGLGLRADDVCKLAVLRRLTNHPSTPAPVESPVKDDGERSRKIEKTFRDRSVIRFSFEKRAGASNDLVFRYSHAHFPFSHSSEGLRKRSRGHRIETAEVLIIGRTSKSRERARAHASTCCGFKCNVDRDG